MRQVASLLSGLLAISSACVALMSVAMMGHSVLTPQSRLPRLHDEGPSLLLRLGVGGVGLAIVLGLLSYALSRFGDKPR